MFYILSSVYILKATLDKSACWIQHTVHKDNLYTNSSEPHLTQSHIRRGHSSWDGLGKALGCQESALGLDGFGWRLQGLNGEGGVETWLHVVVARVALGCARHGLLRLEALGDASDARRASHSTNRLRLYDGLRGSLSAPASRVFWQSHCLSRSRVGGVHKLVDELLATHFLDNVLWKKAFEKWERHRNSNRLVLFTIMNFPQSLTLTDIFIQISHRFSHNDTQNNTVPYEYLSIAHMQEITWQYSLCIT